LTLKEAEIQIIEDKIKTRRDDPKLGIPAIKEYIEERYTEWMEYNIKRQNNPDDFDMQYRANYLWTRYKIAKDYAKKLDDQALANDPEL